MKKIIPVIAFIVFVMAGCAWNDDNTLNFSKTFNNMLGGSGKSSSASQNDGVVIPGKYVDDTGGDCAIIKKANNQWIVTLPAADVIHTDEGRKYIERTEDFDCDRNGNILFCPFADGEDYVSEDVSQYGLTIIQIDQNTIDTKTNGAGLIWGTGGGPGFPLGMCKRIK